MAFPRSSRMTARYNISACSLSFDEAGSGHFGVQDEITDIPRSIIERGIISPESAANLELFFSSIEQGEKSGSTIVRIPNKTGAYGWYRLEFSNIDQPKQAFISICDITELREKQLAFDKWRQSFRSIPPAKMVCFEYRLIGDRLEQWEGELFAPVPHLDETTMETMADYIANTHVFQEDTPTFLGFFSRKRMIECYKRGALGDSTEFRRIGKGETPLWTLLTCKLISDPDSEDIRCFILIQDIDSEKSSDRPPLRSSQEEFPGLLDRAAFIDHVQELFASSGREACHAIMMVDLDNFRLLNDAFGHKIGNEYLTDIANDLRVMLRSDDLVCRIGGDELMVCLKNIVRDKAVLERRARHFCQVLKHNFDMNIVVTGSIGVSVFPKDGLTFEELYNKADIALNRAKSTGKNRYWIYSSESDDTPLPPAGFASEDSVERRVSSPAAYLSRKTILVADSSESHREFLCGIFEKDYDLLTASDGREALDILAKSGPVISAVLINISMRGIDGFEVLTIMSRDSLMSSIPAIITDETADPDCALRAIELGAVDYIPKPIDIRLVGARLKSAINRRETCDLSGQSRFAPANIEEEDKKRDHLRYLAEYDQLTWLYNSTVFERRVSGLLESNPRKDFAIIEFDINRFRVINDIFGHEEGDELLKYIADRLRCRVGANGVYCRVTTDIFAICIPNDNGALKKLYKQLESDMKEYHLVFEVVISYGVYIGNGSSGIPVGAMLDRAGLAKRSIKGNFMVRLAFYDEKMRESMLAEQEIVSQMRAALDADQFVLYLQPKCRLDTGDIIGAEVLIRWAHPEKGLRSPGEFIPVFEKCGFIMQLDTYIWERTCQLIRKWLDSDFYPSPVSISANISRVSLYNPKLCETLTGLVEKYGIPRSMLQLEVTESAYAENPALLAEVIHALRASGFVVQMDDFGSGYSSLNMLKDIDVDVLKIDMNFLSKNDRNGKGGNILTSVVRMARWLNLPVIAEGVETAEQAQFLRNIGCSDAQGYHFYRPMPVADFEELMKHEHIHAARGPDNRIKNFDIDKFWSIDDDVSSVFNSVIGAMAIYEVTEGSLEALKVNEAYYEVTGYTIDQFYEMSGNALKLVHPEDQGAVLAMFSEAYETQKVAECDYRRFFPDGSFGWMHARVRFLAGDSNRSLYYVSLARTMDVVQKNKLLEAECEELRKKLLER